MKRLFVALMLCLISIMSFGQLNIQTAEDYAGYKVVCQVKTYGFNSGEIRFAPNTGYYLIGSTDNQFEKSGASIFLGETKENMLQSINDLKNLQENGTIGQTYILPGLNGKKTEAFIITNLGFRTLYIKTEFVAGKSSAAGCLLYKLDKYIKLINEFEE